MIRTEHLRITRAFPDGVREAGERQGKPIQLVKKAP